MATNKHKLVFISFVNGSVKIARQGGEVEHTYNNPTPASIARIYDLLNTDKRLIINGLWIIGYDKGHVL